MRIVHIVASIENEAAGPSVSVPRLAEAQANLGADVKIATVDEQNGAESRTHVEHVRFSPTLGQVPLLSALKLSKSMRDMLSQSPVPFDVVHSHGLWLAPNIYPSVAAKNGAVWVVSPRGMLGAAALQYSALKKKAFWHLAQKPALSLATLIHATSQQEVEEVRSAGIEVPAVVVPNGVDLPLIDPHRAPGRIVLSLGRIHPKKGLSRLVDAWSAIADDFPQWSVLIAGPDEGGHAAQLRDHANAIGCQRLRIEGARYGEDKLNAYRQAGLFVLSTLNENFAMTVAEALASETPVISTYGAPWAGLEKQGCGLWIDHGPRPLAVAMRDMLSRSDAERWEMGRRGRSWMAREFSWDGVARSLISAYETARRERSNTTTNSDA